MKKFIYKLIVKIVLSIMRCVARIPNKSCKIISLQYLAQKSLEKGELGKARNQARQLLSLAPEFQNGFLDGNAIHHANIIIGKAYLEEGNIYKAKQHLLKAGNTPGSPQLNSFGPNMSLAKELLILGEASVTLEYLKLCSSFWKSQELSIWATEIKDGKIPEFKGNLIY